MAYWLAIGSGENWTKGFKKNVFGLSERWSKTLRKLKKAIK